MKTWVRKSLSVGVLTAGALLVTANAANAAGQTASDNDGILNGTQLALPVSAPVTVGGIGVGILGEGSGMVKSGGTEAAYTSGGGAGQTASGNNGVLNGTQVYAPISVPITIGGVGVGVLGSGVGVLSGGTEASS